MFQNQRSVSWVRSIALAALAAGMATAVVAQPSLPNLPQLPSGVELPGPELPPGAEALLSSGSVTFDVDRSWRIDEIRSRDGRMGLLACAGVPRLGLGPSLIFDEFAENQVGIGYINDASNERRRCRDAVGWTHHAAVTFDPQPLHDATSAYSAAMDGSYTFQIKTITVRMERTRTSIEPHDRCVIGRRAPLGKILVRTSPFGIPFRSFDSLDIQVEEGAYTTVDGEDVGFGDRFRAIADHGVYDEVRNEDGSTTLFMSIQEDGIDEILRSPRAIPTALALLSVKNTEFDTNRDCFAAYRNIRLVLTYDFIPLE